MERMPFLQNHPAVAKLLSGNNLVVLQPVLGVALNLKAAKYDRTPTTSSSSV